MDDVRQLRPRPAPRSSGRRKWIPRLIAALVVLVFVGSAVLRFWVDLMWFEELGQRDVFTTRLQWSMVVGLAVGLIAFAALLGSLTLARRVGRDDMFVPFLRVPVESNIPDQPVIGHMMLRPIAMLVSLLGGLIAGAAASGRWETVLGFIGRSSFNQADPLFNRDLSFHVFTVPLLQFVVGTLQAIVILTALATFGAYIAMGVVRYVPVPRVAKPAAVHLTTFLACFLILQAVQFKIGAWNLVHSTAGLVTGAGYTDVHVRLPGSWVMVVVSLAAAVAVMVFARQGMWRRLGFTFATWIALTMIVMGGAPALVQKFSVDPNELEREGKVLANNIKFTRIGFDLTRIREEAFTDNASLTAEQFAENTATTSNIRLWSPDVLGDTLTQIQEFRPYYQFNDVDVDRYQIGERYRQVMLSAREVNVERLSSPSWINQHLQYTHGYGVVGAWPDRATRQGRPELFLRDIPPVPVGQEDIVVKRPEVYFGEEADNYVLVGSREKEFDFPDGNNNKYTSYTGKGGIEVGNLARRLAFATTFGDQKLLLTGSITNKSRIMFRRNVNERVKELAPFLKLDGDPYIMVKKDGSLIWIVDAYTTSDRMPYSNYSPVADGSEINYVRNSVKAVVDAYNGTVTLYDVSEGKDPILKTWRTIFPNLFVDGKKMSKELVAHLRYPEDMFSLQTDKWLTYHMGEIGKDGKVTSDSVRTFYNEEDVWAIPELDAEPLDAFYILAKIPGEKTEEMLLVRPIVPSGKKNLIAYMGARMDPGHYGEVFNLKLSKQSLTQGPQQVSARIRQDEDIAAQLTLWTKGGTQPRFGNLLVLPIAGSLLYVQPIYLQSAEAELPEFERVVLVLGDTVAWGSTFDEALVELLDKKGEDTAALEQEQGKDGDSGSDAEVGGKTPGGSPTTTPEQDRLLKEIGAAYSKSIECRRDGDWECYGTETERVGKLLKQAGVVE